MTLHEGEVVVQRRAGITREGLGSASVGVRLPDIAREFLGQQRMLIVGGRDCDGLVWATAVYGEAGFVRAHGERTVIVEALPLPEDPLTPALDDDHEIAAIAIEPATRRRMRINGRVRRDGDRLIVTADQVFANCPKYIQPRMMHGRLIATAGASARRTTDLGPTHARLIADADTFFVATHAAGHGADVSHRGGSPGFVALSASGMVSWPEYRGNSMFMTLGNLALDPTCGLLFLDWAHGRYALRLTGRARIDWDPDRAGLHGAERMVDFEVDAALEIVDNYPAWKNS